MTLALQVANRMREAGISWNKTTYLNLIKAVIASGQAGNDLLGGKQVRFKDL